jgi:hypothetical protein
MPKKPTKDDPLNAKLDHIIELLEMLVMLHGKRYGLQREDIRKLLRVSPNRVSAVTQNVAVPPAGAAQPAKP